jgi:hypothetical protein
MKSTAPAFIAWTLDSMSPMAGHEDYWHARGFQLALQFETSHPGHLDIKYQTRGRHLKIHVIEEILRAGESEDIVSGRSKQPGECSTLSIVVVNNKDEISGRTHHRMIGPFGLHGTSNRTSETGTDTSSSRRRNFVSVSFLKA